MVVAEDSLGVGREVLPVGDGGVEQAGVEQAVARGEEDGVCVGVPEVVVGVVGEGVGVGAQDGGQVARGVFVFGPGFEEGVGGGADGGGDLGGWGGFAGGSCGQGVQAYRAVVVAGSWVRRA
ncbi:hypothetical protein [Kitasatospora purpeofusca]|uniref:hypothetical protein n=1 Tax=Kitasatospora purpeofusca TaxID=67352 RepID=UPI003F4AA9B9